MVQEFNAKLNRGHFNTRSPCYALFSARSDCLFRNFIELDWLRGGPKQINWLNREKNAFKVGVWIDVSELCSWVATIDNPRRSQSNLKVFSHHWVKKSTLVPPAIESNFHEVCQDVFVSEIKLLENLEAHVKVVLMEIWAIFCTFKTVKQKIWIWARCDFSKMSKETGLGPSLIR